MNKKTLAFTLSTAVTAATISVTASVTIVTRYKQQFKSLSESMACLKKMRQDFDITLSPVIISQSNRILMIVDDNDYDIKQGFNTTLTISHIMRFQTARITVKTLKDLDDEVRKLISYTYMRYGIKEYC